MDALQKSVGVLKYSSNGNDFYRLTVEVDQEISNYYRSLIPKWHDVNRPRWPAHITVVRPEKEKPVFLEHWNKHNNREIEFQYTPTVFQGKVYFWLNAFCTELEQIRKELGLPVRSEFTLPPEGFTKCFHITIANLK